MFLAQYSILLFFISLIIILLFKSCGTIHRNFNIEGSSEYNSFTYFTRGKLTKNTRSVNHSHSGRPL